MLRPILTNWRTSGAGVAAATTGVLVAFGVVSVEQGAAIAAFILAVGLLLSQDAGKSDQDQGLRPEPGRTL